MFSLPSQIKTLLIVTGIFFLAQTSYSGVSATFPKSDSLILTQINQQIAMDPSLVTLHVNIGVNNTNVSVSGQVPKQEKANALITLIASIAGVQSVDVSELTLNNGRPLSPDEVINSLVLGVFNQEGLTGPLSREPATVSITGPSSRTYLVPPPPINIQVKTKNRVVYLSGTVPNQATEDKAINLAKIVPDVVDVQSTLEIETGQ